MGLDQTVIQAKRFGVFTCREADLLHAVAARMVEEDISSLVVVDADGYLQGIVTRMDLLRLMTMDEAWGQKQAQAVMNREVITVRTSADLYQVAELLLKNSIHRVVVVQEENGRKKPVSVISAADLVYHMVQD
jgi:signal-transduction protein with cAMP-binding, CBS, and nucleotidyltransferase domain